MAMADGYGLFWNSNSGDRKYDAKSFEKWLKKFFTSGVFEGDLQVLASSGMTVQVQTGYSNVNGKVGLFESATNVTLNAANSRYPRIDTIIIERNDVNRVIQIDKVTGAYTGENPQPTAPIWDETQGIYQLVLAQIYVGAGVSSISQEDITDKRTDTDVCGYIAGTVNEMDFSQFTAQFEAYFSTFEATQLAEFEEWFDHMKDQLDSDAAGHLQAEVDEINVIIAPDQLTLTASQPYAIGEQFIYGGKLYTATSAIAEGGTIVIGTNASLSAEIVKQIKSAKDAIGNLASLTTDAKTSVVAAINEVDAHADNAQSKADIVQSQLNAATQSIAQNTTDIATNAAGISALNTGLANIYKYAHDSNSIAYYPSDGLGIIGAKVGRIVCISIYWANKDVSDGTLLYTLPSGQRPVVSINARNAFDNQFGEVAIDVDGNIYYRSSQGNANYFHVAVTYVADS